MDEELGALVDPEGDPETLGGGESSGEKSTGARIRRRRRPLGLTLLDLADAAEWQPGGESQGTADS